MKRILSTLLIAALGVSAASAQTVTLKLKSNVKAEYNLNDIKGLQWNPIDESQLIKPEDVPDLDKFYWPGAAAGAYAKNYEDLFKLKNNYNFHYCKQSEHFFCFWDKQFGEDPSKAAESWARVDVDDLLEKAEQFFHTNVEVLGMAKLGNGTSMLDNFKMQIWLIYDNGWVATGSGWGEIGALWVTPSTCKPVGSTIAHEIGHSFQFQVGADRAMATGKDVSKYGFRYGWGGNGGCAYWEQCAQWQSFQDYPDQQFWQDFNPWLVNYHRHFCHEWMRYQSYWLQSYWVMKRGIDAFGSIWRESVAPEDPIQCYMRLYLDNDVQAFWDEYYDYASRMVTYDIDNVRQYRNGTWGASNQYNTSLFQVGENKYQVAYSSCPETSGFNIIRLNTPAAGTTISVDLQALPVGSALASADTGEYKKGDNEGIGGTVTTYNSNSTNNSEPDFRIGIVSIVNNEPVYSDMAHSSDPSVSLIVPDGATDMYLVVVPTPAKYTTHAWDVDDLNDEQWPYTITLNGTDLFGHITIDTTAEPANIEFTYDIKCDASTNEYAQGALDISATPDLAALAQAFVMQPSEIAAKTSAIANGNTGKPGEGKIVFGLMQPDGTIAYNYTANVGFYINADGTVGSWGAGSPIWVEYDKENFVISHGQYPKKVEAGVLYTVKPCLVYTKDGVQYVATFTLNLQY